MTKPVDVYVPTAQDRERVRIKPGQLLLSGDGVFATRQGEGITAGKEAVFVRLHRCNLTCGLPSGWKCDTDYTWDKRLRQFWQEPRSVEVNNLAIEIEEKWHEKWGKEPNAQKRMVFTGGEPLLQQRTIAKVMDELPDYLVEFETNGTFAPISEIHHAQINCSPKLENSGNSLAQRRRPEILKAIAQVPSSYFKFVVTSESDFAEIDEVVATAGMQPHRVLIMPEGRDATAIMQNAQLYAPLAEERGYQITRRHQLEWFGDIRAT